MTDEEILQKIEEVPPEGVGVLKIRYFHENDSRILFIPSKVWLNTHKPEKGRKFRSDSKKVVTKIGLILTIDSKNKLYRNVNYSAISLFSAKKKIESLCFLPGPIHNIGEESFNPKEALSQIESIKRAREAILSPNEKKEIKWIENYIVYNFLLNL